MSEISNTNFNAHVLVREINIAIQNVCSLAYDHWKCQRYISQQQLMHNAEGMMLLGRKLCIFYGINPEQIHIPTQLIVEISGGSVKVEKNEIQEGGE